MTAAPADALGPDSLAERLAEEMRRRWERGERPQAEEFLAAHPILLETPQAAAELIYEEICLRREHGQAGASSEVLRRFPQWSGPLRVLLDCDRALASDHAGPVFPAVGEALGGFALVAELGRGAQGRVFLATQPALADRPVVLKFSPPASGEHLALARLQHTHIVPLYSIADFPERRLRVLCMPYFGGATLAALLAALRDVPPARRTGADLVRALERAQAAVPLAVEATGPTRSWLMEADYGHAVCWLGARLADALQYAHERGLLHLDLKPSNVLLAADGQPMLLDFHLARGPVAAGAPAPPWLGGTPDYLPPEQRSAMEAVRRGGAVPQAVDRRSDVYALGLVLYEALAGGLPAQTGGMGLRARNPEVSAGLADLVARCLTARAEDRYPDAAVLADDLRRHLADQPLRGVANRNPAERWRKWRRRQPQALWRLTLLALAAAAAIAAVVYIGHQLDKARAALAEGQQRLKQGRPEQARVAFQRGLALAEDLPFGGAAADELAAGLRQAERAEVATDLHAVAERLRVLFGADDLPRESAAAVERLCRGFWERRGRILARLGKELSGDVERQVRADLLDLAVLWSDLRVRLAPADGMAARREALRVLAEAEQAFGPNPVLYCERHRHAHELGLADVEHAADAAFRKTPPRTAWEHYAVGCSYLRAGSPEDLKLAAEVLESAVDLEPKGLWPQFARGRCAYLRGEHQEALTAFSVCIALADDSGICYYNRGLVYQALGRDELARRDFDRAVRLDPTLNLPAPVQR